MSRAINAALRSRNIHVAPSLVRRVVVICLALLAAREPNIILALLRRYRPPFTPPEASESTYKRLTQLYPKWLLDQQSERRLEEIRTAAWGRKSWGRRSPSFTDDELRAMYLAEQAATTTGNIVLARALRKAIEAYRA